MVIPQVSTGSGGHTCQMKTHKIFVCFSKDEDDLSIARDIAEFEKNIHLSVPVSTLDGFNVCILKHFEEVSLYL